MYAVISDRTRQAGVRVGDVLACDFNDSWAPGQKVVFDHVLLLSNEGAISVGRPTVKGARVVGEVLSHVKAKKVVAFRYKPKKNVRVKRGHRQSSTHVKITAIET